MGDDNRVWDTALDLLVYGPLGLAVTARDELPGLVHDLADRGRRELGRRRAGADQHLRNAHAMGRFAVTTRVPKLREGIRSRFTTGGPAGGGDAASTRSAAANGRAPAGSRSEAAGRPTAGGGAGATDRPASRTVRASGATVAPAPAPPVEALPIPDYDELSASQVVERLAGLGADDLDAVRRYEAAQRGRQTILGRIAQLSR